MWAPQRVPHFSTLFKCRREGRHLVILKANASLCVSLQKRHKADNTVNKKKTTGIIYVCVLVNVHQLSLCSFPWVCLCLFVWVLFSFHGWVNSCCLSLTIVQTPDKSLVAMNTVWALLYRLTDGSVVLVSQCCGAKPGRRSSGNRYHRLHLCCFLTHHSWALSFSLPCSVLQFSLT